MNAVLDVLHAAFHDSTSAVYRVVWSVVWVLILGSIALIGVALALPENHPALVWLNRIDMVVLGVFALELVLRVVSFRPPGVDFVRRSAAGRLRAQIVGRVFYMLEPLNIIDLLTVIAVVPALRTLRALRLFRLLRSVPLFKYASPMQGIARAFRDNALLYVGAFSWLGMVTLVGGISIYLTDRKHNPGIETLADGMWWALVTITTVGFGDISPATSMGRVVGSVLMVLGMFTIALFAGIVGSTLLSTIMSIRQEQFRMSNYVDHVVICGYDTGTRMLLDTVRKELGSKQTVVIFANHQQPDGLSSDVIWVRGDPTKESELDKVRLAHAKAAIVVGSRTGSPQDADARTILTLFTLRRWVALQEITAERVHPIYVVAEILDAENVEHAHTAGADEVIETTRLGFSLLAHAVAMPGTAAVMSSMAVAGAHNIYVGKFPADLQQAQSFGALAKHLKRAHGALLIGVQGAEGQRFNPADDEQVQPSQHLIYLAERPSLPIPVPQ